MENEAYFYIAKLKDFIYKRDQLKDFIYKRDQLKDFIYKRDQLKEFFHKRDRLKEKRIEVYDRKNEPLCPEIVNKQCLFNYLGFKNGRDLENGVRLE